MDTRMVAKDDVRQPPRRRPTAEARARAGLPRREWMTAAAALFLGSCAPGGPEEAGGAEELPAKVKTAVTLPSGRRFARWNTELKAKAPGRDVTLVDLDALDHNIEVVKSQLGPAFALRVVTKSLPSLDLIEYVMNKAGTHRLMAFSEGLLRDLLLRFGSSADILLGRPTPIEAARRVFAESPRAAADVKWLVDTKERMIEYRELAVSVGRPLHVVVEIDVGLRRGGARTVTELLEMLAVMDSRDGLLRLEGFMGYEGHVPFAPPGFDSDVEFAAVHERYSDFVAAARQAYPAMFHRRMVMDSGGSGTYHRYSADLVTPVNEVSMGSAFLLPEHFADLSVFGLRPAAYQASAVLKRVDPAEVPFAEGYLPYLAQSNPSLETAYYMVGAGFPGELVHPAGLIVNPFMPEGDGVKNLMSNQQLRNGPADLPLEVGDFVFYHPWEGGGLAWLSMLEVLRDDTIIDRWPVFREGCVKGCGAAR